MGSFYSLQIAKSGLYVSQKALEVTGNNISNANTKGYSRQRLDVSPSSNFTNGSISVGSGVVIDKVEQIRNKYLDTQFRNENSLNNELSFKTFSLNYIEGIISEPSDYGLNASLSDLFNSIEALSYNAQDTNLREIVVQNAVKLTDNFRLISGNLIDYQQDVDNNVSLMVEEVNRLGEQICALNKTIFSHETKGLQANELRDRRGVLLDSLSALIPVSTQETTDGRFKVKTGSSFLVDNFSVNKLEVKASSTKNQLNGNPVNKIYWQGSDTEVEIKSGKIKGLLDIRDGATRDNQGIPYYINEFNVLANDIISGFNDINNAGFTLPFNNHESTGGVNFFSTITEDLAVLNIKVSDDLLENGSNIATSSEPIIGEINWGNNENIQKFINLRDSAQLEEHLQSIISDLAITTSYYSNRSDNQANLTAFIENQKLAVSGVSIDEEMTNLLQYQHSYNAAAKVISAIDEMLSTLINI